MSSPDFLPIAHSFWARHLGIPVGRLFAGRLNIVAHSGGMTGYGGVFGLFRDGATMLSLPAKRANVLHPILSALPDGFSPEKLAEALQAHASMVVGPAYVGYLQETPSVRGIAPQARAITKKDAEAVAELRSACTEAEWEHGGSDVQVRTASGAFAGRQLAALAGYEVWGGTIAHIAIVTHPAHRGQGYGRAAVAHAAARALKSGLVPQYRTLDSNHASLRIAKALGFHRYATSLAVRLKE